MEGLIFGILRYICLIAGIKQSISFLVDRINLSLTYRPCPADEVEWKMN